MKNKMFLLLIIVIVGCKGTDSNSESKKPTFAGFLSELSTDSLPFFTDCNEPFPSFDKTYTVYREFMPVGGVPHATFESDSNFTLIIFTHSNEYSSPYLYSYNKQGGIIDSIGLHIGTCQKTDYTQSHSYSRINKNLSMELSDSLNHYSFDGENQIYDSTTVLTKIYNLNSSGQFEFVKESVVTRWIK